MTNIYYLEDLFEQTIAIFYANFRLHFP